LQFLSRLVRGFFGRACNSFWPTHTSLVLAPGTSTNYRRRRKSRSMKVTTLTGYLLTLMPPCRQWRKPFPSSNSHIGVNSASVVRACPMAHSAKCGTCRPLRAANLRPSESLFFLSPTFLHLEAWVPGFGKQALPHSRVLHSLHRLTRLLRLNKLQSNNYV
jgi:hypothetical protein